MRKREGFAALLLCLSLLFSFSADAASEQRVLVYIEEDAGFTVTRNGLMILPGEDAVFELQMDRSVALTATDYPGDYSLDAQNRTVTLTLRNVQYPTRVRLTVSTKYCTVTYDANG